MHVESTQFIALHYKQDLLTMDQEKRNFVLTRLYHYSVQLKVPMLKNASKVIENVLTHGIPRKYAKYSKKNAKQKLIDLQTNMEGLLPEDDLKHFKEYISEKRLNRQWGEAHVHAMNQLLERNYQNIQDLNQLQTLLGIICWLFEYKVKAYFPKKVKTLLDSTKYCYLQDLFVTLLLLILLALGNKSLRRYASAPNLSTFDSKSLKRYGSAPNLSTFDSKSLKRYGSAPNLSTFDSKSLRRYASAPNLSTFDSKSLKRYGSAPNLSTFDSKSLRRYGSAPSLPKFDIIFHVRVSPEDELFQSITLRNMLQILDIHIPKNATSDTLARAVVDHFKPTVRTGWIKKGVAGVLTVVKDQSRYLTMRTKHLRRNFVVSRTRAPLNQGANEYRIDPENSNAFLLAEFNTTVEIPGLDSYNHMRYVKWLLLKPPDNACDISDKIPPGLENCPNETTCVLTHIHHAILNNETLDHYGRRNHPQFKDSKDSSSKDGYLKQSPNENFRFLIEFARATISEVSDKRILARRANAFQQIIALRSYLSSVLTSIKATDEESSKSHAKVLFLIVAFRALVMYKLPINPSRYGVQQVGPILPQYAKRLTITLPFAVCTPKPCQCSTCTCIYVILWYLLL